MNLQFPDLSIVGAPKCGTSSLHAWLGQLPSVCPAQPKETFYFMDADHPWLNSRYNFHKDGTSAYKRFFKSGQGGKTLDSTTHYYYQQTAIEQFCNSGTRVCLVLRDPTQRLLSYFQYVCLTRGAAREPVCFGEFVRELLDGDVKKLRDRFVDDREFFTLETSLQQGQYVDSIKRWQAKIDPDNLKIMLFEEVVRNRDHWLKELCKFFDVVVTDEQIANFTKQNETVGIKYPGLNRIVKSAARLVANERLKQMGRDIYMKLQKAEKPDLTTDYEAEITRLYEYYKPFNQSLSELLGLDLSGWTRPHPQPLPK